MGTLEQSTGRAVKSQRMDWYLLRDWMLAVSTSWSLSIHCREDEKSHLPFLGKASGGRYQAGRSS